MINYTMLADFYEFTMANGYFENGCGSEIAIFDMLYKKNYIHNNMKIFALSIRIIFLLIIHSIPYNRRLR